ncbi:MAG: YceD family protein [Candidatus Zhuqueibacterota bacterium]
MKIKLTNLHEGLNSLDFVADAAALGFDEEEEKQHMFPEKIDVHVEVHVLSDKFFIKAESTTLAHYECDRCLADFQRKLNSEFQLVYSRETRNKFEDDVYRFLEENAHEIDISQDVRDSMLLALPMKHVCSETCKGLCPTCGVNLNQEQCNCATEK